MLPSVDSLLACFSSRLRISAAAPTSSLRWNDARPPFFPPYLTQTINVTTSQRIINAFNGFSVWKKITALPQALIGWQASAEDVLKCIPYNKGNSVMAKLPLKQANIPFEFWRFSCIFLILCLIFFFFHSRQEKFQNESSWGGLRQDILIILIVAMKHEKKRETGWWNHSVSVSPPRDVTVSPSLLRKTSPSPVITITTITTEEHKKLEIITRIGIE